MRERPRSEPVAGTGSERGHRYVESAQMQNAFAVFRRRTLATGQPGLVSR